MQSERPLSRRLFGPLFRLPSTLVDAVLLLAVPAALVAVYSLPEATRRALVLEYTDPTALAMFSSHFVHLTEGHLLANLLGYAFVVTVAYLLSVLSGRRQQFRVVFVALLVSLPIALSALNLLFIRPRVGYGFSGVVMGYFGFLPLALFGYFERQVAVDVGIHHSPVLFFVGIATISIAVASVTVVTVAIAVAALLICVAYALRLFESVDVIERAARGLWKTEPGYAELGVVGVLLFVSYPIVAFPADPIGDGTVVDLYTHLLGYSLGFISTYSLWLLSDPDGFDA